MAGTERIDRDELPKLEAEGALMDQLIESVKAQAESEIQRRLREELDHAEWKAIDALSRYKFEMFGYWAGIWVHLNRVSGLKRRNPFGFAVKAAKAEKAKADV